MPDTVALVVVDDDADVGELLRDYPSDRGYEVREADSAATARARTSRCSTSICRARTD